MDRFGAGSMPFVILAIFGLFLPLPVIAWLRGRGQNLPNVN
jgi:hypothetical protein